MLLLGGINVTSKSLGCKQMKGILTYALTRCKIQNRYICIGFFFTKVVFFQIFHCSKKQQYILYLALCQWARSCCLKYNRLVPLITLVSHKVILFKSSGELLISLFFIHLRASFCVLRRKSCELSHVIYLKLTHFL